EFRSGGRIALHRTNLGRFNRNREGADVQTIAHRHFFARDFFPPQTSAVPTFQVFDIKMSAFLKKLEMPSRDVRMGQNDGVVLGPADEDRLSAHFERCNDFVSISREDSHVIWAEASPRLRESAVPFSGSYPGRTIWKGIGPSAIPGWHGRNRDSRIRGRRSR